MGAEACYLLNLSEETDYVETVPSLEQQMLTQFLFFRGPMACVMRLYYTGVGSPVELDSNTQCRSNRESQNLTLVSEFYLMGFSEDPELQPILFGLFLSMYLVSMPGSLLIIRAVHADSHLHTPMYFFLWSLSWADMGLISTTVPNLIVSIQIHSRVISHVGCLTQMSLFVTFGCMDDMLLTVVAYDRFVAICHPLNYHVIMNPRFCVTLLLVSFLLSFLETQIYLLVALQMTVGDPWILFSYYKIVSSILSMQSLSGRSKAFSTCVSHLSVVFLFWGTGIGVYIGSVLSDSYRNSAVSSLMYSVVTPMLNPFIYSLRNRDIKSGLRMFYNRII
ncbi:olfactory receptor 7E24-like [Nannospalax galili]|uniref:olfactory receptor 7E24-like n=1 Tax=Nannospalax galili TaxID=1026970 RepID=UPI00111BF719|nr:olfactory receptor 7E24-like [Nannospalax galili]